MALSSPTKEPEPGTRRPQLILAYRKQSSLSDDTYPLGDAPLSKRPTCKITKTRKAREADRLSAESDDWNVLGYAFPRKRLNWRVKDLNSVHLAKNGSI
jgi:hypothetical protein